MKIGTVGTGFIVHKFLSAVKQVGEAETVAMYSRGGKVNPAWIEEFGVKKVYTSYEEMLSDPLVDCVYVASPNSLHFEHSYRALEMGKNVICEKPFTSTVAEAEKLAALAKEKKLFLFEAISTIYLPNIEYAKQMVDSLGDIKVVHCNYSQYSSRYDNLLAGETPNVFNPAFSGGSLADINIYNLHFVMHLFGEPEEVRYFANKHANGIDTSGVLVLRYPTFVCTCVGAKDTKSSNYAQIQGLNGYLYIPGVNGCKEVSVCLPGKNETINLHEQENHLYYETFAFNKMIAEQDFQQCYKILDQCLSVMRVYEQARKDAGVVFAADQQ